MPGGGQARDWSKFRVRGDREWRRRRAVAVPVEDGGPAGQPASEDGYDVPEYGVTDFGDRLLSGPASELFGGGPPGGAGPDSGYRAMAPAPGPSSRRGAGVWTDGHPSYPSQPSLPPVPPAPPMPPVPPPTAAETSGLVRPYFRTGGRTKPKYDLAIEALISTSERGRELNRLTVPEHRSICGLCLDTRSVAEVAAYLRLPLGVVRVLIGDIAGLGLVLVHGAATAVGDRPSIEFMERVLSGLRRI
ncbi:DUF742 domain-containing protein [Amycolatopsis cynarae]|uniref:DUF742 domain-containing protein n=1 Tax=Amycolatopsis cynarae TaxID=2995223 RepID=A0ABY7BFQ9_9PSEU|nr:DUF742 domain-containing protein [Amycolatopsis sp. HUAS 11-8]WAL69988.1 DUF742 domain-containing protein [Amycolatopsis sp. HUAS 11-8]